MNATGRELALTALNGLLGALIGIAVGLAVGVLVVAVTRTPSPVPAHFGNCPAGQHWEQAPGNGDLGWECAR